MNMNMNNHYYAMFFIMILSGFLSTMNIWANRLDDVRISLNDIYMVFLMTGWMFFFMGFYYKNINVIVFGAILVSFNLYAIRTQLFITQEQYLLGMIPHHSMAVLMSERLKEKSNNINSYLNKIITNQTEEIAYMKSLLLNL